MAEPMTLTIITPDAIVYDGKADFFVGHAIDGEFGVLPNHAPMIIALDIAPLRVIILMDNSIHLLFSGALLKLNTTR